MPNLDLGGMIALRSEFTAQEWMDLLLRSCGYEPAALKPKQKLHFIARMVPLVEHNYNLCELGPRGTGKSHVYKEISPYSILVSGGQTTTANLFGRMNATPAPIRWRVLVWWATGTALRSMKLRVCASKI